MNLKAAAIFLAWGLIARFRKTCEDPYALSFELVAVQKMESTIVDHIDTPCAELDVSKEVA